MALLFGIIGGLIIGWIGNSAAGFISFVVIWVLVAAYEEQEALVRALQDKVKRLESEVRASRNFETKEHRKEWYEYNNL